MIRKEMRLKKQVDHIQLRERTTVEFVRLDENVDCPKEEAKTYAQIAANKLKERVTAGANQLNNLS